MSKMFLDPTKPLHTCIEDSCEDCEISDKIVCHFNFKQLVRFLLACAPCFALACFFFYQFQPYLLIPWISFILAYFGLIEIKALCSHCPHYAEPGTKSLKCWANYGSYKFWHYNAGPLSPISKTVFLAGLVIIFFSPLIPVIIQGYYVLLTAYIVSLALWTLMLKKLYCHYCINFACPLNSVDQEVKDIFFEKNPTIKNAWKNS